MAKKKKRADQDASDLTFEDAIERIETIVDKLEAGQLDLNESLARYEEGVGLLKHCYGLLNQAEQKIELLTGIDDEGNIQVTSVDDTATQLDEGGQSRANKRTSGSSSAQAGAGEHEIDGNSSLF